MMDLNSLDEMLIEKAEEDGTLFGGNIMAIWRKEAQRPIAKPKGWLFEESLNIVTFNTDNMVVQRFPFRSSMMDYIFEKMDGHHLLKLYQTCKFFYDKFRLNIIENLIICETKGDEYIAGNSMAISYKNPAFSKLNNLWISESFTCHEFDNFILDLKIFSKMTIQKLVIWGYLSLDEFKFLAQSSYLTDVYMSDRIDKSNEPRISFAEIFHLIPKVTSLCISWPIICFDTMNKLFSIERQTKFKFIHFEEIFDENAWGEGHPPANEYEAKFFLDPKLVAKFLTKYGTFDCQYKFEFNDGDEEQEEFNQILESELKLLKQIEYQSVCKFYYVPKKRIEKNNENCMTAVKPVSEPIDAGCAIAQISITHDDENCMTAVKPVSEPIDAGCSPTYKPIVPDDNTQTTIKHVSTSDGFNEISTTMTAAAAVSKLADAPSSSPSLSSQNTSNLDFDDTATLTPKK